MRCFALHAVAHCARETEMLLLPHTHNQTHGRPRGGDPLAMYVSVLQYGGSACVEMHVTVWYNELRSRAREAEDDPRGTV